MCNHLFIHCTIFIPLLILKLVKNQNYILSVKQCYTGLRLLYIKGLMTKEVEEFPVVRTSITSDNSILSVYFYSDINRSRRLGSFLPLTAAKFGLVWKSSDHSIKNILPIFSYLNKVLCVRGTSMWVRYFSIHELLTLHAIIAIALLKM